MSAGSFTPQCVAATWRARGMHAVERAWAHRTTAEGPRRRTAAVSASAGTAAPNIRVGRPCSASPAFSASSGRVCCSPGTQARTTGPSEVSGRPGRGDVDGDRERAGVTRRSVVEMCQDSRCSTSTYRSPDESHLRPTACSVGTITSCQAAVRPYRSTAEVNRPSTAGASSRTAARASPRHSLRMSPGSGGPAVGGRSSAPSGRA